MLLDDPQQLLEVIEKSLDVLLVSSDALITFKEQIYFPQCQKSP
ncbi:MAG: hypothetical protein ACFFC7_16840 [Candidatus Hermodarchaeota archaeon]